MRLYLDTSAIIYSVEGIREAREAALGWIQKAEMGGLIVTSHLSRLECRVRPLRDRNDVLLARYDALFTGRGLDLRPIDIEIIDRATEIRARHGFKTPDAIHMATAVAAACDVFLTGDIALTRYQELKVEIVGSPTAG
jgi:predicted nucleic acid-binding protein